tara:strand:- start:536 stop:904 length:369 start_codon:yes stop_codon:yes gene_type:complete
MTELEKKFLLSNLKNMNAVIETIASEVSNISVSIDNLIQEIEKMEVLSLSNLGSSAEQSNSDMCHSPNDLIRQGEVLKMTGLSRTTIYTLIQRGDFPSNIKLSARSVAWRRGDIWEWINSKV